MPFTLNHIWTNFSYKSITCVCHIQSYLHHLQSHPSFSVAPTGFSQLFVCSVMYHSDQPESVVCLCVSVSHRRCEQTDGARERTTDEIRRPATEAGHDPGGDL